MGKIAASVLLKLFNNGNKRCRTADAHLRLSGTLLSNVNNTHSIIPEDQKSVVVVF